MNSCEIIITAIFDNAEQNKYKVLLLCNMFPHNETRL
jgi:hypothetical protein